jgi:PhnB protein
LAYHSVNPFVIAEGAEDLIGFLGAAFAGSEQERITRPDGTVGHAEVAIGDSVVMLTDANAALPARPSAFYVFVDDVDACYRRALAAGAVSRSEPADQFYGIREAGVIDRWGNIWWVATVVEQVAPEELQARYDATV